MKLEESQLQVLLLHLVTRPHTRPQVLKTQLLTEHLLPTPPCTHTHTMQRYLHCNDGTTCLCLPYNPEHLLSLIRTSSFIISATSPSSKPPPPFAHPSEDLPLFHPLRPHTQEKCAAQQKGVKRGIISLVTVTPGVARKRAAQWGQTFLRHFNANRGVCCSLCERENKWSFVLFTGYPLIWEVARCLRGGEGRGGWEEREIICGPSLELNPRASHSEIALSMIICRSIKTGPLLPGM